MTRVMGMPRVSDARQGADDRFSFPMQRDGMQRFCTSRGWDLIGLTEINGESAFSDDIDRRPEFRAVIEAAERREFDVLLVYDFSRFARSNVVAHTTLYRLRRAGVRLLDINGTDYTDDDTGEDRAVLESLISRRSSKDHSRRVRNAIAQRHARGLPTGDIPFGYRQATRTASDGTTMRATDLPPVVVADEAAAIRWAHDAYRGGLGYLEIAREFNRRGLRPHSKQGHAIFTPSGVHRILNNPFYVGIVSHHGHELPGLHEPILDGDRWNEDMAQRKRHTRAPRNDYLFSGIASCVYCARPLEVNISASTYRYYRERRCGRPTECIGTWTGWRADDPEQQVHRVMEALAIDREFVGWVDNLSRRRPASRNADAARSALMDERARLRRAWAKGHWEGGEQEYDALMGNIARQLGELGPTAESVCFAGERLREWADVWHTLRPGGHRRVLREMVSGVRMDLWLRDVWLVPRADWEETFSLRRKYGAEILALVRPGGPEPANPLISLSHYAPSELVEVA